MTVILWVCLWGMPNVMVAQPVLDTNHFWHVEQLSQIRSLGEVSNVSVVDGRLYFFHEGHLSTTTSKDGVILYADIAKEMLAIDNEMNYVVKHPVSGQLYFTKRAGRNRFNLYEVTTDDKGRVKPLKVKFSHYSGTVVHPVFSRDGEIMVFSSDEGKTYGGFDLFYSMREEDGWGEPQNLGHHINSSYDEFSPSIWGDYLLFSSNRGDTLNGTWNIYSSRLISTLQTFGDTIVTFPIGYSQVQRLPYPVNSDSSDYGIVYDDSSHTCIFVSQRYQGRSLFHAFNAPLNSIAYQGTVSSYNAPDKVIANARLEVYDTENPYSPLATYYADNQGNYRIYTPPQGSYTIRVSAPNHLSVSDNFVSIPSSIEQMLSAWDYSTSLMEFHLGEHYPYQAQALFGAQSACNLTSEGAETLSPLARFMRENEHLRLTIISVFSREEDETLCSLMNQARLRSILNHLKNQGVDLSKIETQHVEQAFQPNPASPNTMDNVLLFKFH